MKSITNSAEETIDLSHKTILELGKINLVCLYGDLGAGKTTFTKGIATFFGIEPKSIKSPTYTYIRHYQNKIRPIYHIDLYRINEIDELLMHEIGEIWSDTKNLVIIEWADKIEKFLPSPRYDIQLKHLKKNSREITICKR